MTEKLSITERLSQGIALRKQYLKLIAEKKKECRDAERALEKLEQDDLPSLFDEAQMIEITLRDGTKVSTKETVYTTLKKGKALDTRAMADATGAIEELKSHGINAEDFFEEVYIVPGSPSIEEVKKPVAHDKVLSLTLLWYGYKPKYFKRHLYSPPQISALGRELLEQGISLSDEFFSQHLKRGVKITEKKGD